MKIIKDYTESDTIDVVEVIDAKYIADYSIEIYFNDNTMRIVDFKPFLSKSLHPSIAKYLNKDFFIQFELKNGNLNWNDYELIFPIYDLHEGII